MKWLIAFLLMLCTIPAHATIAYVQGNTNTASSATTVSAAFMSNNTAGCLLTVTGEAQLFSEYDSGSPWLQTPTDLAGDTFILVHQYWIYDVVLTNTATWMSFNSGVTACKGGANTVTMTSARAANLSIIIEEHSGSGITLDQQQVWVCGTESNTGTTGVIASPTVYTSNASELLYAWAYNQENAATLTVNNSYTIKNSTSGSGIGALAVAERNVSVQGAYSTTFSGLNSIGTAGGISFSEGGTVIVPAIEQTACGDNIEPWHELGVFSGQDVILNNQKSGDRIYVGYRTDGGAGTPTISNANSYTWTVLQTSSNYVLWDAVVPMDEPAGDIISFGNVSNDNASRVVELHGLASPPTSDITSAVSATMSLTLGGYTTPSYTLLDSMAAQWYGSMFNVKGILKDFLIAAQAANGWATSTIPGTSSPGIVGTDLFPTDFSFLEIWLPGAPLSGRHKAQVY